MKKYMFALVVLALFSCKNKGDDYDASGTFEADEIWVTAHANGTILELKAEEGQQLSANQEVGIIDGKGVELQKEQILASINAIEDKTNSASPQIQVLQSQYQTQNNQIAVLQEQLKAAIREKNRTANLVNSDAAPRKQLDDANSQVLIIQKQMASAQAQLSTIKQQINSAKEQVSLQNRAILSEKLPAEKRVLQINNQLKDNIIESPISGTVLTKFMYKGEYATLGKPIFKMANLSEMILKIYITGDQFAQLKPNQTVKVFVDSGDGTSKELNGTVTWMSSEAEFTPKTIQTKKERANLVYSTKVKVKNDGFLKIGMYGDVKF